MLQEIKDTKKIRKIIFTETGLSFMFSNLLPGKVTPPKIQSQFFLKSPHMFFIMYKSVEVRILKVNYFFLPVDRTSCRINITPARRKGVMTISEPGLPVFPEKYFSHPKELFSNKQLSKQNHLSGQSSQDLFSSMAQQARIWQKLHQPDNFIIQRQLPPA